MNKTVLLSAGGTGGHLFPAQALAQEMKSRGWTVHLATDPRAKKFLSNFPADGVHIVKSATFGGKSPVALFKTFSRLGLGYLASRKLIGKIKPDAAVGFGGYPTVPPLLAASHAGLPTILHEQNAVMGRANRFLASRVAAIATGFELAHEKAADSAPIIVTGNPLRQVAHDAAGEAYVPASANGPFNLLVFGGSQGARFFSQSLPPMLEKLEESLRQRLNITLQARPEDAVLVREALEKLNVTAHVESFFADLPARIAASHLVVCRSGASSVSELALIGRPSILVPLPGALDDDQGANAAQLERMGGAVLVRQADLTTDRYASLITNALQSPQALTAQAQNAKKAGVPDAAKRLAHVVEAHV
ncbi:MAG: undecaprenyldiphospho-muramoylpentapeptide beta-N-acetylglucosaminyltransferase [Pseudomonadota bacterium]